MPTFNDPNAENQNNQPQPRFKPFSVDEEMMSPADQQLGNEVGMLLQSQRDKKLEDDYFQTVRDNANADEETRFASADKYFAERYGIETHRGAAINSGNDYKMKPFESSAAYENALVTMAEKGYEGIASERYKNLLASERLGDEAATKAEIIKQAQIETEEDVDDLSKPYVTSPGVVTYQKIRQPRKQEDIDRDVAEYRANVLGENFVALFEHFRPDLSEEGERIVRAVVKNGSLPADEHMAFNNLYAADPKQGDLVKFLAEQAKETEYDLNGAAGRGMAGMLNQIIEGAGEKIGQGLYRFSSGLDAMDYAWTGSSADRLNRMNRTERDEYERLRAEGLGEKQAIDNVAGQMQKRFLNEMLCLEDRTRSRRAELALKDLMAKREWEHYGYWENAYIGAATTVPYMAVTAVPYAGFAVNVFSHMQDVEDQIVREGGDPTKAQAARAIGAVAWSAIEKMELKGFGRSLTKLEKTVMWRHLWQGQAKLALGELGTAAKTGGKDILLNWAKETGQEGLQGTIESIETDLGLDKDAAAIFKNALERTWDETKNSAGTMAIISTAFPIGGAVIRAPFQRRQMQDRESVVAYITRQEQLKNMLQGAYLSDQGTPEMQTKRVTKAYNEIQNVWDASATPQVAMEKYQEIGYTEDEAVKIAEYFDMRAEILRNAAQLPEAQGLRDAMIAGNAFRVGQDTTFNPADLFHIINANIVTEEVEVPTPGEANAAPQKALRVTVPMKDANGAETTKDFTVVVNNKTPDIETPAFASSVAQATQGTEVQKTADEYLAMSRDEKEAFLLANDLKQGGNFQVLDQDGKTIFSSDALVQLARANSAFVRKGGNWTLAHETAHGIVAFARQMGVFDPDADTTKVMVKLFGGPTNDKEAWNEEAMADAFAEYLRGKYDFKGLSRDERGIVERVFDAVIDFFKNAYYRLTGKTPDPSAVELKAREQAMDAVFEGIRSGDFSGLSAFAGIDFGEDQAKDASQKPQEGHSTASAAETKNEPSATEEAAPAAPGTVSAPSAATTAAEERVKQTHAAQNGVKVTQATPTQASLQAQLARIEAKLAELTADPKGAAANVPTPRKAPKGEETRATPQGGVKFKVAWQWIPRAELVTSDKAEYPQEFQPRDRASRVASDLQVIENTRPGRFDPMKLAYSYDSDGGAPIVAGGNVVLSGNGRSMMLGRLAKEGRYADYLTKISDWADEYGIGRPPAGMKEPVLVQRITSTDKRDDLLKIAELSNRAKILTRSEAENAEADAKLITPTMMRLFRPSEDGDLQAASNADFMQAFISSAPDAKGLTNADGTPTDQAVRRVQNALLSAVLGQDQTTRALLKTLLEKRGDLGLGDLYRALIKSSGALLSNRTTKASFDLLPHIRRAVGQYVSWRSARLSNPSYTLDEHLRTSDMFAAAPSKETEAVARLLEAGRFGRVLDKYNELVSRKAPDAQASFFAEDTAYQTLAKAERAVLLDGETPVTLDPTDAIAAEPLQAPPAEVTPAPVAVEPEPAPEATETTTETPAPAIPVAETFEPQPVRRGTATIPARNAEKMVAYQVDKDGTPTTTKKVLPVGAYNLLRGPYDVRKPPKASVQDKAGRGLGIGFTAPTTDAQGRYWGKIFPHFQGNKTEMADRTSQAIRKLMPKAERESYKTVVDYFGGGGCWGLYHALTNFPNADRLAINEWEQGRIAKIRLLHEKGAAVADEASKLIIEDLYAELKKACMVGEGNTESGSGTTIATKLEPLAELYRNDDNKLGLIYAVVDCAHTMLANKVDAAGNPSFDAGFDAIIENLREDGKKAKEAADAFKARGGQITYRQGDAANYAEAPAGTDVVAVCDPPYYLTAGYNGQVSVPIDANGMGWDYKTTRRMLDGLVDKGDAIVYTDEAWWFKETYTPDQQEDLFGGGSPFAQEQEILLGIINALDHFDVAGRVVGRQEVLGINHGHKTTDGRAEGVAGTPRGAGATAEDTADGRGVQGNHPGDAMGGLAAGAEGQDAGLLGDGAGRGREGDTEQVAIAREIAAVQIEEAAADAGVDVTQQVAQLIRSSVRQVREKHILDYAKTVSKNAKAWIKRQEKALDRQMAEEGYTEKVWNGTGVEDFNVFRLATREEHGSEPGAVGADKDIKMAFFSYQETTAENYAALSSYDIDTDYETLTHGATPNVRQYYVNKGKCLEIDEASWPTTYQAWTETLRKAHADGYNSVLCRNAVDDQGARLPSKEGDPMEWLDFEGTNEAGSEYDGDADGFKTDILVVFDQPNDPGANRIKAADPVTFWDEKHGELPIPLEMRANRDFPDLRFSVTMGERAKEEARAAIEKYRPGIHGFVTNINGTLTPLDDAAINDIETYDTPKERKAALLWFCKNTVRLPEDHAKVVEAIKTAERAKVDPMQFERPGDIIETYATFRPKAKPINPDKVPELTDRRDLGHGIVTYLVQDDKAGQSAMRKIINTHFGKDASPWCLLQGDGNGNLTDDAWYYWNDYNVLPKRVAFKDGRLCAFMATDGGRGEITAGDISRGAKPSSAEEWWDRNDAPHPGIPFRTKDEEGRTVEQELTTDGAIETISITKGDPKAKNGIFEAWNLTYHDTSSYYHVVTERRDGNPFRDQRFYKNGTLAVEINYQNNGRDHITKSYGTNGRLYHIEANRGQDYTRVDNYGDGIFKVVVHEYDRTHEEASFEEATAIMSESVGITQLAGITREYLDAEGRLVSMDYQYIDGTMTELRHGHKNVTVNDLNRLYLPQIKADDIIGLVEAAWNDGGAVITRISDMANKDFPDIRHSVSSRKDAIDFAKNGVLYGKTGNPTPLFHFVKSGRRFEDFDMSKSGPTMYGNAAYFFTNPKMAKNWGNFNGEDRLVVEAYSDIKNPYVDSAAGYEPDGNLDMDRFTRATDEQFAEVVAKLEEMGWTVDGDYRYDGYSMVGGYKSGKPVYTNRGLAFLSNAIKKDGEKPSFGWAHSDAVKKALQSLGYDGVVGELEGYTQIAVFDNKNIRMVDDSSSGIEGDTPRLGPVDDAAYLDAVKRGDRKTALRMIRKRFDDYVYTHTIDEDKAKQIFAEIAIAYAKENPDVTFGIRKDERLLVPESVFPNSHQLFQDQEFDEDGNPLYPEYEFDESLYDAGELDGTSTLGFNVDYDYDLPTTMQSMDLRGPYSANYVYLVAGDDEGSGLDAGERLIGNAKILSVLSIVNTKSEGGFESRHVHTFTNKSADITFDDAGNVIPLSKRFGSDNPDVRFSVQTARETPQERHSLMVGIKGADRAQLAVGRLETALRILDDWEARRKGQGTRFNPPTDAEFRNDVYQKTGWWMGTDGMWRVEIPDLKPMQKAGSSRGKFMVNGLHTNDGDYFCLLDEICSHESLFNLYPGVKNYFVRIVDPDKTDYDGMFDSAVNKFTLTWNAVKRMRGEPSNVLTAGGLSTLTHEIQHAVQEIENFARGGNSEYHGEKNYWRLAGEVEARNAAYRSFGVFENVSAQTRGPFDTVMAPWETEDVPTLKQFIVDKDGKTTDLSGRRVRRASVRRGNRPMKAEDVAAGFLAARILAGKETSVEDADRMLKNVGLRVDGPAMLERAKALADRNRDRLRASVEAKSPEVVAALANANLQDRATDAFNTAITTGAAAADPDIGVTMQRTADRFAARELQTAKGFTAAQMQAELPISLADAVFAVAEYEKTPEEKARLEEWKKKRDEEKTAAEEARKADPDAETPIEEAERLARDLSYREPSAEERAYFDQLMDRARFADEARAQEELRQKLADQKKKAAQAADNDNADNDDNAEGAADEKDQADAILPFDTVKRIAPVFESSELFAQFVVEWTTDHILKMHPELQNREDLWKSPVAVKELVKTSQHLLRDLAKQTLGSPSINSARNYVDQAIINLADYKTFRAIRKNVAHIYDRIHDNALRISRRKLVSELIYGKRDNAEDGPGFKGLRALAGVKGRFSATAEAGDRAIDAKTELWCRWLIPYLTMTEEAMQKEEDRLRAIITRHDTEDEAYGYNKEDNTQYAEAKDRLALLNVYGGMVRWLPGKIIDAREQILEQVNGKRQAFEQARAEREAEDKTIRDAIIAAVEAGASDDYLHRSEVGDRLDRILYSMNGNLTLEMQNLIRFCKDPAKREAALLAIEDLSVIVSQGTERYRVTLATARKEVNDGLAAYYGNAEVGIRHLMHDQVPEDVAKRIFTQSRQKVQTYGQLLQLYATTIQADYKENAEKHGRTANLELMEQTLTPQDIAFHAWAVNWYAANREALSDAVEEITGLGVTSPDRLYCPARMDRDPDGFTADAVAWSPVPSALNRRVVHGLDFSESANFLSCVMEQAEVRAQTIGYGMTGIRLRDIIAHHELQKAVRKHVGRADMRLVTDHVKDVLVQGAAKKDAIEWLAPLNFARKWMARFYLSGSIPSALKQLASMPVWANAMLGGQEIGLKKCLGYLTSVGTEDGRLAIEDLIKSDGFRARYQMGWSEEIQNLLSNPSKNRLVRYFEKAYDKGMLVNKAVDAVSCLWMAQGFYRDAKALFERRGFTQEQAKDNALALTWSVCENGQQSGRIENLNKAQRHGGALVSAVFQFKTAFLLQNNYIIQAIRDTRAGTPGAKGRLARGLFINTVYIPAFVGVVEAIWSAVLGEKEPPEDPEKAPQWLKDFAWSMIDGVTAPLFMTGSIIHAGFNTIFGKTGYDDNASIPAVEGIMRVGKHAGKAIADTIALITPMDVAEEVTPEKVKEDLLRLAADVAAPVRHVRRAIKNREEE